MIRIQWLMAMVLTIPVALAAAPVAGQAGPQAIRAGDTGDRLLSVILILSRRHAGGDARIVEALDSPGLSWFTHVLLHVPSWQEYPDAANHPLVLKAVEQCRKRGVPVIWGRWLWVAWPRDGREAHINDHFDPSFYERTIRTVKREAKALGAVGTVLDVEPYGACPQRASIKRTNLTADQRHRMQRAIEQAVSVAEPVTYVFPTSSPRPGAFHWALTGLGELRCDARTYYTEPPRYRVPKIRPPEGCVHRLDLWGTYVGLGGPKDTLAGGLTKLTIDQAKALELPRIKRDYPECRGIWVYVDHAQLPEVLRAWQQ